MRTPALLPAPVARLVPFAGLAVLLAAGWADLVRPAAPDRTLLAAALAVAVAVGLGALDLAAGRLSRRRAARAVRVWGTAAVALGALAAGLLLAGVGRPFLAPGAWGDLAAGLGQGLGDLPAVRMPYAGLDPWTRTVVLLGAPAALTLAALVAFRPGARTGSRAAAALLLLGLHAVQVVNDRPDRPWLLGAGITLLLVAFLGLERVPRRAARAAGTLVAVAVLGGVLAGTVLDRPDPWLDYEAVARSLEDERRVARFDWDHRYGAIDWPREGRELLRVRTRRPTYLAAEHLDRFDGLVWRALPVGGPAPLSSADLPAGGRRPAYRAEARVTVRGLRTRRLPGVATTLVAEVPGRDPFPAESAGTWRLVSDLRPGDTYRVRGYAPRPTVRELRAAGAAYPPGLESARAFELPARPHPGDRVGLGAPPGGGTVLVGAFGSGEPARFFEDDGPTSVAAGPVLRSSPYAGTWALAQRLRRGATTPDAYVRRVERYLADGFAYDEAPPRPRGAALESFLLRDRRGFCQQFSGAMALLLRMGGIPARVVTGFTPGRFDERRAEYVVRDLEAHSWVEAYVPDHGWVTFDPTPPVAPARQALVGDDAAATPASGGQSERAQGLDNVTGGGRELEASEDGGGTPGAAGLAALAAVALVAGAVLRRRRRRVRAGRRAQADADLADLERALARMGRPPAPAETLHDLERRLARWHPEAGGYCRALAARRYAGTGAGPTVEQRRALRTALAREDGRRTARWRALRAVPPRR